MLKENEKYYVVHDNHSYGYILNNSYYEYAFGTELRLEIKDNQIIQMISRNSKDFEPDVIGTIKGDVLTNKHGGTFKLQTVSPNLAIK